MASAMDEPQLTLVSFTLHPRTHRDPRAPSVRMCLLPRQEMHHDEVDVELRPLPPLGLVAAVEPVPPRAPIWFHSTRNTESFVSVVAVLDLGHGNAVPADAAVPGGRRIPHRR